MKSASKPATQLILKLYMLMLFSTSLFAETKPFADIHIHFNWDQKEIISAAEVVKKLKDNNVVLAQVFSTPSHLALELADAAGPWLVPYFSPYISVAHKNIWSSDEKVLIAAKKGLESGRYKGIGEVHVWSGFGPRWDNKVLVGLLELAEQYDVPFLIHTEASSHLFFQPTCQKYPNVKFLWAHSGGRLKPPRIDALMANCPNVWNEVSVRDPWRYDTLVDDKGQLLPGWKELLIKYQDRFMTGTDPVWSVTRGQRWDSADEGWDHFEMLLQFHRDWLKQLPAEVEQKIRLTNAQKFLGQKP